MITWFKQLALKLGLSALTSPAAKTVAAEFVDSEIPADDLPIAKDFLTASLALTNDFLVKYPNSAFLKELQADTQLLLNNLPTAATN